MSKKMEYNFCKNDGTKLRSIPLWVFDETEVLTHIITIYQCPKCMHVEATIGLAGTFIKKKEEHERLKELREEALKCVKSAGEDKAIWVIIYNTISALLEDKTK